MNLHPIDQMILNWEHLHTMRVAASIAGTVLFVSILVSAYRDRSRSRNRNRIRNRGYRGHKS